MRRIATFIIGATFVVLVMAGSAWSQESTTSLLKQLREDTDRFDKSLNEALDRSSSLDGTELEDEINRYVKAFDEAIGNFKEHWEDGRESKAWAGEVMVRGRAIDRFLKKYTDSLNSSVHTDWASVKMDIGRIAKANNVKVKW